MKPLHVLTLAASFLLAPLAHAGAMQALAQFVESARAGQAAFTQTVTAPPRQGQAARSKTSSGHFEFQRPGRFRFDYEKPFAQTIVADGHTLWLHDPDLNQVTARPQEQALGASPAALFASAATLQALQKDFDLSEASESGGLQWVSATPRASDGPIRLIRIGFKAAEASAAPQLAALEITDSFGQHSAIAFSQFELRPSLPATRFQFTPPDGADVMRQ